MGVAQGRVEPPVHNPSEAIDMTPRINRRTTVSGLINEYHRAAWWSRGKPGPARAYARYGTPQAHQQRDVLTRCGTKDQTGPAQANTSVAVDEVLVTRTWWYAVEREADICRHEICGDGEPDSGEIAGCRPGEDSRVAGGSLRLSQHRIRRVAAESRCPP